MDDRGHTTDAGEIFEELVIENEDEALETSNFRRRAKRFYRSKLVKDYGFPPLSKDPMPEPKTLWLAFVEAFKNDWRAGFTVSLVSLPLSISLSIAGGATPVMGMITAAWAGLLSAIFQGCIFNIVGPTGALSGLLMMYSIKYDVGVLPYIAIYSGILCLVILILRLDIYLLFIGSAVMLGFTLGVAVIIGGNQLQFALGLSGLHRHEEFYMNIYEGVKHIGESDMETVIVFLITFVLLFAAFKLAPKVPWIVVFAILGVVIGVVSEQGWLGFKLHTLASRYGNLDPHLIQIPPFNPHYLSLDILMASVSVAFIAALETLISAQIAYRLTGVPFNKAREMLGVSLANIVTGFMGGIPATAALARTALNIRMGAKTRLAALLNAILVFIISLTLLTYFRYLVLPVVASILVVVAVNMIEIKEMKHMWAHDRGQLGLAIFTALVCIFVGPTEGIVVGAIIGLLMLARSNAHAFGEITLLDATKSNPPRIVHTTTSEVVDTLDSARLSAGLYEGLDTSVPIPLDIPTEEDADTLVYQMPSELTFLNMQPHAERLERILASGRFDNVIISLRYTHFLDMDAIQGIQDLFKTLSKTMDSGGRLWLCGVNSYILADFSHGDFYKTLINEKRVYSSVPAAINALARGGSSSSGSYGSY
eukprot:TRINITY_DN987_c0_g1_i1.p1 TRINITY_DN987_c0_g1~~TRINITY_DN987_c0_g1_i1.p1  ORF type:complete len:699 (-),score=77.14 TRINITY_DN987_c0_g1_i1:113-2065(-)